MSEKLMSDEVLFLKCKRYGSNAKFWRQKFLGLLPDVNNRRLYEKKGFSSIFVFAAKLGGVSEKQVRLALNLKERFAAAPALQALLISGEVSINKLARVASIVTAENQEALAAQTKILSKSALETLVRDEKFAQILGSQNEIENNFQQAFEAPDNYSKPEITQKSLPGHYEASLVEKSQTINDDLKLLKQLPQNLKTRLSTMAQKGINIGELLNELLDQHEEQNQLATSPSKFVASLPKSMAQSALSPTAKNQQKLSTTHNASRSHKLTTRTTSLPSAPTTIRLRTPSTISIFQSENSLVKISTP